MKRTLLLAQAFAGLLIAATATGAAAHDAHVAVLSAGAIEPGLKAAAAAFEKQNGHAVKITFNTAPELKKRMDSNPAFDVVIAPPAVIGEFAAAGKLAETRANVGRVGMGVAVRDGAPAPDISSADGLKRSVLAADSLVFNRASTGLYLEGLLKKMDVYTQVEGKTTRYPDGAAVMEHVIKGKGNEIGFGAITEILLYQGKGLKFVGPVPAEVQNYTSYTAAPLASGKQQDLAQQFVSFLSGPVGKPLFVAAGVTD
ncbi:molybdate transport system substrate-binding protein [Polaromonas sp. YR568]|uniref:substrate-binding domain-containing protein n=1 Tax=Polaromonas sp. YR568 TaxID=1855301 RepID=UPI0008F01609|nr:substrate-binding domain-containing protein [Polaromonas sp. YR568]SFU92317.1 molybdate transport system substrate-binding protein [Polaromonas sp. YR568]